MSQIDPFVHLECRVNDLLAKYVEPQIVAERDAIATGQSIPQPDQDSLAAFLLLSHAELEEYFETKAKQTLDEIDADLKQGRLSQRSAALVFLYLLREQRTIAWKAAGLGDEASIRNAEQADFKSLVHEAVGFGRRYVGSNNGIKEGAIRTLAALAGRFGSEVDELLVAELNEYGKQRGNVAHRSQLSQKPIESPELIKRRVIQIVSLTKSSFESPATRHSTVNGPAVGRWRRRLHELSTRIRTLLRS